jgi:hypothetical protein
MDSGFNYRQSQVQAAELHRRAEIHRQVSDMRVSRRRQRQPRPSLLAPPTLTEQVRAAFARLRHRPAPKPVKTV